MNCRILLSYLISGMLLLSACNRNKPASPSADNSSSSSTASAPADSGSNSTSAPVSPDRQAPRTPAPPPPKPVVIPSGTVLTVRLQQAIGSKSSEQGDRFQASLAEPVVMSGKTVIPAGSITSGTVTEAHAAGRFKGGATLNVVLDSLTVRGAPHSIQTTAMAQQSKGKGKRTATMVGGGAGVGALIGGVAGGGKGAAIGGLVGAGAGTAGAGMTGNRDIALPAESALSFQMTAPLTLKVRGPTDPSSSREAESLPPQ
jgi:hypothetical protein